MPRSRLLLGIGFLVLLVAALGLSFRTTPSAAVFLMFAASGVAQGALAYILDRTDRKRSLRAVMWILFSPVGALILVAILILMNLMVNDMRVVFPRPYVNAYLLAWLIVPTARVVCYELPCFRGSKASQ